MMKDYLVRFDANLDWLFKERPFEERFDLAAAAGFTGVEFPVPYRYPVGELVERLRGAGLHQVLINTPVGAPGTPQAWGTACQPDRVAEFRTGFHSALRYATSMGTAFIHVIGGTRPEDVTREVAFDTYRHNVDWAAAEAAGTGITVVVEAINQHDAPGFVLESVDQGLGVIRELGHDNLRLMLDIYHAGMNGEDITACVDKALPVTAHVQIADVPGRHEPGSAGIAWKALFAQLAALGYEGWVGCEFGPTGTTADALTFRDAFASTREAQK